MLDHLEEMQHYNTNRRAKHKQSRLAAPRRTAPLVPMRVKCLTGVEVMKMSFGTNIVPATQQRHRIEGKRGGQRDPRMHTADYRPSIPNPLAQTPLLTPNQPQPTTNQLLPGCRLLMIDEPWGMGSHDPRHMGVGGGVRG